MYHYSMVMVKELRKLGELELSQDAYPEELHGLKTILEQAGLIVRIDKRTLTILVKVRD